MRTRVRVAVGVFTLTAAGLTVGCGGGSSSAPVAKTGGPPAVAAATPAASGGKGVFDQHCTKCHVGGKAPDLSSVGAKHDAEWIAEHTKNPKAHKPMSKMPAFAEKLSAADIKAVADHLAAQK